MKGILKYWNKISLSAFAPFIVALLFFLSCKEPDPFSEVPQIKFLNLEFVEVTENGIADSLILEFEFQDGDGNLGLPPDDNFFPIQDYFAVTGDDGTPISISAPLPEDQFLYVPPDFTIENSIRLPDPEYFFIFEEDFAAMPEFDCEYFEIVYINESRTDFFEINSRADFDVSSYEIDTILIYRNPNRYNFFIEFFRKRGTEYEPLNLAKEDPNGCIIPFHGRFPVLDIENIGNSLEGTVKYSMSSLGFRVVIRKDLFKIRFHILDHQFQKSNVVEAGDFTLDELIR